MYIQDTNMLKFLRSQNIGLSKGGNHNPLAPKAPIEVWFPDCETGYDTNKNY